MDFPYGGTFAALCVLQGALVAAPWRRPVRRSHSRLVGIALPFAVLAVGVTAARGAGWSTHLLADLATYAAPPLAGATAWVWGWRPAWSTVLLAPGLWIVAWRVDGLLGDVCAVAIVAGACLTLAAIIAAFTPRWALAVGLCVLALVDSILVFSDQVRPASDALHAIAPPLAGGHPLPALQDATLGHALFGWLDILAPALAATLFAGAPRMRLVAAGATAVVSLAWGLMLSVSDSVPGTVPPVAAVIVWWFACRRDGAATTAVTGDERAFRDSGVVV